MLALDFKQLESLGIRKLPVETLTGLDGTPLSSDLERCAVIGTHWIFQLLTEGRDDLYESLDPTTNTLVCYVRGRETQIVTGMYARVETLL